MGYDDLIEGLVESRAAIVNDISLFLCGHDEDSTKAFLHFWNRTLERDIEMTPPVSSRFILFGCTI
jgi:hypothetical protein